MAGKEGWFGKSVDRLEARRGNRSPQPSVAKPGISTADRLGSRQGSSRAGWRELLRAWVDERVRSLSHREAVSFKSEKRGVQVARNGPSENGKCWQRVELGIHGPRAGAATGIEKSEKRGVQAARNGPTRRPPLPGARWPS